MAKAVCAEVKQQSAKLVTGMDVFLSALLVSLMALYWCQGSVLETADQCQATTSILT